MSETIVAGVEVTQQQDEDIPILFLHRVERTYRQGDEALHILNGAELAVWPGQSVALVAPSGAGKSTLLHIAGLLEHPDHGDVYIDGRRHRDPVRRRAHAHPPQRDRLRLPVAPSAAGIHRAGERAAAADDPRPGALGGQEARGRAARLSRLAEPAYPSAGGALRRRAAARCHRARGRQCAAHPAWPTSRPAISICTPPTMCSRALTQLVRASGLAAIIATHNMDLAARMDRRVTLREGRVAELA